jgi:hypothetical protein
MNKVLSILALTILIYTSCKKDEDLTMPRLFRPVAIGSLTADSNTIDAAWQPIAGAIGYKVEVSRDTFRTIDMSIAVDTSAAAIKKLLFNQLYQVQVKAVARDTTMDSKWSSLGAVKTLSSIFRTPGVNDITLNSVRARWVTRGAPVTSIKVIKRSDRSVAATVTLTDTDLTNEYVVIDGLDAATPYTMYLYSGNDERGFVDFSTKAPFTGTIIDLTVITGRPGVLQDTLPKVPSGSTILLSRGETYTISTATTIDKTLTIMSVPDLTNPTKARIYFTSNFVFGAGATIDYIEFNDVYMQSDNYGSRYVFNNTNSANIGKLVFTESRIEIFRGLCRLQSGTANIGDFIINNCIVDSIGNYFVLNINAASKVDNITLSNSTFYKVESVIASAAASNSVTVSDCTFNETPLGNNKNYYFDYNALNVTNGFTVTNCIFGIGKVSSGATTVRDIRTGSGTSVGLTNSFKTTDHVTGANEFQTLTSANRKSTELWLDPYKGLFFIADQLFTGRNSAGDPRWR